MSSSLLPITAGFAAAAVDQDTSAQTSQPTAASDSTTQVTASAAGAGFSAISTQQSAGGAGFAAQSGGARAGAGSASAAASRTLNTSSGAGSAAGAGAGAAGATGAAPALTMKDIENAGRALHAKGVKEPTNFRTMAQLIATELGRSVDEVMAITVEKGQNESLERIRVRLTGKNLPGGVTVDALIHAWKEINTLFNANGDDGSRSAIQAKALTCLETKLNVTATVARELMDLCGRAAR